MYNRKILRYSFLAGSLYFFAISVAHLAGFKIPGLFIYYNVSSHQYQDNIISFLAFGWAVFYYVGYRYTTAVKEILLASMVALVALAYNTLSTNFDAINGSATSTFPFWAQIVLLASYVSWLCIFAFRADAFRGSDTKD